MEVIIWQNEEGASVKKDDDPNFSTHMHNFCFFCGRYSDFDELRRRLQLRFAGMVIPPLPGKKSMGKENRDFLRKRMRGLSLFLKSVVGSSRQRVVAA